MIEATAALRAWLLRSVVTDQGRATAAVIRFVWSATAECANHGAQRRSWRIHLPVDLSASSASSAVKIRGLPQNPFERARGIPDRKVVRFPRRSAFRRFRTGKL